MADKELSADGVVTGYATVDGRLIHLASQDLTVAGGAVGEVHCAKITEMMQLSLETETPGLPYNLPRDTDRALNHAIIPRRKF